MIRPTLMSRPSAASFIGSEESDGDSNVDEGAGEVMASGDAAMPVGGTHEHQGRRLRDEGGCKGRTTERKRPPALD